MAVMSVRILVVLVLFSFTVFAQVGPVGPGPAPAPRNLKLLKAADPIMEVMREFNESLGVQCLYCHVQGDFASDAKPQKESARKMIALVRNTRKYFPITTDGDYPGGFHHDVDCFTCHRGTTKPETKSSNHFLNKDDAEGFVPPREAATNLKVLPPGTEVHGAGSIMEDFRDALQVNCWFCHSGGPPNFAGDESPRKEIGRSMIAMTREVNASFPGTGAYPAAPSAVSCYTCHRGNPSAGSFSNKNWPFKKK
jgi:Photosynthetic reaction centre cytochrome C subunit